MEDMRDVIKRAILELEPQWYFWVCQNGTWVWQNGTWNDAILT